MSTTSIPLESTGADQPSPARPGPWRAVAVVTLYFALQIVIALLWDLGAHVTARIEHRPAAELLAAHGSLMLTAVLLLAALPTLLLLRLRWPTRWRAAALPGFGLRWPGLRWILGGLLLAALLLPLVLGLNATLFPRQGVTQSVLVIFDQAHLWMRALLTLMIVLLAPFVEEVLFRGVLLAGLSERMPLRWAVTLSVLLFALLHLPDTGGHWQVLPGLIALALGLTWLRLRSGSLLPGYAAHALYNASVLALALWPLLRGHGAG